MRDLHLNGVHEDGEHLLLRDDAGEEYRLRIDDHVRAAARREHRPALPGATRPPTLGPREVQAMIRAGADAEEAAQAAGWTVEKVHRYDGPILAEREHIAYLAGNARLRGRGSEHATTLRERVEDRLTERGVEPTAARWDSWRSEDGQWTVEVTFAAGGRPRTAAWRFNRASVAVQALDDEARWLSGDADRSPTVGRATGGAAVRARAAQGAPTGAAARVAPARPDDGADEDPPADQDAPPPVAAAGDPSDEQGLGVPHEHDETFDLAMSVRRHSRAQQRRGGRRHESREADAASPSTVPSAGPWPGDQALPLADLRYDPETMPPPPAAHADPDPAGVDGRPEPAAAAAAQSPAARPGAGKAPRKAPRAPRTPKARRARQTPAQPPAPPEAGKPAPVRDQGDPGLRAGGSPHPAPPNAAPPNAAPPPPAPPNPARPASARTPTPDRDTAHRDAPDRGAPAPDAPAHQPASPSKPTSVPAAPAPGTAFGQITPAEDDQPPAPPRARKAAKGRGGRASVPSWDDIMFGTRGPR